MNYPYTVNLNVNKIFGEQGVNITLYSGLTTFVGTNASGKTQTLKALRDKLKRIEGSDKVRYLSSNRIGTMEEFRSKVDQYNYLVENFALGDLKIKQIRHQIETANGDFFTMDERKDVYIKVAERMSELFGRQIFLRWDAGKLKVFFGKTDAEEEYSVVAEASGLVNVISILAALFDEDINVLLIDEPEVSLHPQLQSYLLREMKNACENYGKTIVISTHSAEMIELNKAEELCNFVFFRDKELPKQISPGAEELSNKLLKEFVLRMSLIYNEGFFAKKIMLIEGVSDLIICRYLNTRLKLNLDVAGSQIIPVDGKGQFPVVTKLFRLIGKDVCVLTDLDGFIDDNSVINLFSMLPNATKIANSYGNADLQGMIRDIKTKINHLVNESKEDMKYIYTNHPYWIHRDLDSEEDKIMQRAIVAQLFTQSDEEITKWPKSQEWAGIKTRLIVLFDILEQLGCFVLRKGTIESYYLFENNDTHNGKPSVAISEINGLNEMHDSEIRQQYCDLVRALEYAALNKIIDESYLIKKELLSELALVLGVLNKISSEKELLSNLKQTKGSAETIFSYKIIEENGRRGVEVSLCSRILDVEGFPLKAFEGDNVNLIVENSIHKKRYTN